MMTGRWFVVLCAVIAIAAIASAAIGEEAKPAPNEGAAKKFLKKHPEADANSDGVLTMEEGQAFRKTLKKGADAGAGGEKGAAKPGKAEAASNSPTYANVSYGPHPRDVLDFWKAELKGPQSPQGPQGTQGTQKPAPVLIFFHGGSFKAGDKAIILNRPIFQDYLDAGISVVSANYRFSSDAPYPAPMLDGARAVQFVRSKADEWGITPDKVALSGSSAGGTMALWIALHDDLADPRSTDSVARQSTRVRCVAAYSAPATIAPEILRANNAGVGMLNGAIAQLFGVASGDELEKPENRKRLLDFCPLTHATKDDPPLYVTYQSEETETPAPPAPSTPSILSIPSTSSIPSIKETPKKASSIHDVSLGLPLKAKYDALGLEFQIFTKSNPIPPNGEVQFLLKHFGDQGASPGDSAAQDAPGPWARVDGTKPAALLFQLDFENGFAATKAAEGSAAPMNKNLPSLVDGVQGKAARFDDGQVLVYPAKGAISNRRGALAMWIQTPVNSLGEPGMKYGLFREEATGKDKLNTMEWLLDGDWEMRFHPHAIKEYLHIIEVREWRKGDWRHLIINWDADKGDLFAYLDGRPGTWACGSGLYWSYDREPWKPIEHPSFMLGAFSVRGDSPWRGAIDEVRIYDRPLTPVEAREEFLRCGHFSVLVRSLDRYIYARTSQTVRLEFENQADQAAQLAPRYEIMDAKGAVVVSGVVPPVAVPAGEIRRCAISLTLPAPGDFDLAVSFPLAGKEEKRVLGLKSLPRQEGLAPGKETDVLVAKVDAVNPPAKVESAPSRVVDSPVERYREAGAAMHSRFAIPFSVEQIGAPHVAIIRYPDDKPRSMEAVLQNLDGVEDRQLQTAFATGDEYPLSNSTIEQRLLFWPKSKHYALIFMTLEDGYPAAVQSFEIRRLEGGLPKGAAAETAFRGDVPARGIGMYFEDPVLPKNFGASAGFPGFTQTVDRALDYLQWFGQDLLVYPVAWYRGPLYASRVEPNSPVAATRPHPPDFPQYLMKRMAARDMKFLPVFAIHELPSLTPLAITDMARVAAGEETIMNVRRDDKLDYKGRHPDDPDFNCLDARIQQKVKDLVAEFLDRFGDEPALTGLMLLDARHKLFQFGSADSGYNDSNLRRFQEEAGVRIPVDAKDPKRFSKSYDWLRANTWEQWLDWRCRKIHDYYMEIAKMLAARRPDLKLVIGILPRQEGAREQSEGQGQYLPGESVIGQMAREAGIDPSLFKNDSGVEFNFLPRMGSVRFLRSRGKSLDRLADNRTVTMAPEITAPLRHAPTASYTLFDRYWEDAIGANEPLDLSPISGGARANEVTWRVSTLNPNSYHCLENYVAGLNNLDALSLAKGGFVVGTLGTEQYVAQFARAYRALPAVKFDDVEGLADPVRIRQKVVGGCNYFYVLNRLPAPVEARLKMATAEPVADLVSGETQRGESMALRLEPYQLRSFRGESAACRVVGGSVQIPGAFKQSLEKRLDEAARGLASRRSKGQDIAADAPYLDYARKLWTDGQYARLYFSLQEAWAWSGLPVAGKEAAAADSAKQSKWRKKK